MESSYVIGRFKSNYLRVTEDGGFYIVPDYKDKFIYGDDWGKFEEHVHNVLGDDFYWNGLPDLGWTWITDGATLTEIIKSFNSKNEESMFLDFKNTNSDDLYFVRWIDWS